MNGLECDDEARGDDLWVEVDGLRTDYVDAAELLHEHDEEGGLGGAAVALDGEEFLEEILAFAFGGFDFEQLVGVVHIACSLDFVLAESLESFEGFVVAAFFHVPFQFISTGLNV